MHNTLKLNQKVIISQNTKFCPYTIMNQSGKQATIKGFKKISTEKILPIVEFNDKTRIWILHEERN